MKHCPDLKDLPDPPIGKSGWPWTFGTSDSQSASLKSVALPSFCIVTPSFNQGAYLEETIRSVLLQGYPNLEYIIMDGGSTDESVAIIRKYADFLTYWESRSDNGQADALQRGFEIGTGKILGWLNSDDYLLPGALLTVGANFSRSPSTEMLIGSGWNVDDTGNRIKKIYSYPVTFPSLMMHGQFFNQMSSFWRRDVYDLLGGLDTSLRFCFDYDLFLRFTRRANPLTADDVLSCFRLHSSSKTATIWTDVAVPEILAASEKYKHLLSPQELLKTPSYYAESYHRAIRVRKLKDIYRDPRYFLCQVLDKLKQKTNS